MDPRQSGLFWPVPGGKTTTGTSLEIGTWPVPDNGMLDWAQAIAQGRSSKENPREKQRMASLSFSIHR
jgi:hypothetical protein